MKIFNAFKKACIVIFSFVLIFIFSGCADPISFPRVKYLNSGYRFDSYSMEIEVKNGYALNQGNAYEWVKTGTGYDLILHFVEDAEYE